MMIKNFLLDLFFPWYCLECDKPNQIICDECFDKVLINSDIGNSYLGVHDLDGLWVMTNPGDQIVKKIIYNLKYRFVKDLESILKKIVDSYLDQLVTAWGRPKIDLIIPVPISKRRMSYRGFNQSDIIAGLIGAKLKVKVVKNIIYRKHRSPQVGNNAWLRRQNVSGVFEIIDNLAFVNKNILIVDDIVTTGSTIEELAKLSKENKAKRVWAMVIARG